MVRRTIAGAAVLVVVILLVLGFRGCLNARKESAIKDYVRESSELAQQSKLQGRNLFALLSEPGNQNEAIDRENAVNGLRVESATTVDSAEDLDVPDEMSKAQGYFVDSLELRRDSIARIADQLPGALADQERRQSTEQIAQMMEYISASDVLLVGRWKPSARQTLESEELAGQVALPRDGQLRILPDIQWVDPSYVADQIEGIRTGSGADTEATPGLHGNGLGTVALGGVALTPGATATVPLSEDLAFEVQVVNQGENNETDVNVKVSVGEGGDAIDAEETIDTIAVGEQQTVTIPLGAEPPTGQSVPIKVEVEPVAGEEMTDNNSAEYSAIFTS
jgi:hypothetical protein